MRLKQIKIAQLLLVAAECNLFQRFVLFECGLGIGFHRAASCWDL